MCLTGYVQSYSSNLKLLQLKTYVFLHENSYPYQKLFETHESVIDAFSEMGPSVTETTVTALAKLNTKREAMK